MTPEGKVKAKVKKILGAFEGVYYRMYVPGGYGKQGLDFDGCVAGRAFYIEAKAPGKIPTGRQKETALEILSAGAKVFIVSDENGYRSLYRWLRSVAALRVPQQVKPNAPRRHRQRKRHGADPA